MTILIVGAGLSGCVLAERYASIGKKVLVVEKRYHIAGNCYDYRDTNGILMNKYGAHIFHTKSEKVWTYVNQFAEWIPWHHKVYGTYKGKVFPVPINITTVNTLYDTNLQTADEMRAFLELKQVANQSPQNSEELGLARFGKDIYEKVLEGYTMKQWNKSPRELDASVLSRIPIRYSFEEGYFDDPYQALPKGGYTAFCAAILDHPNITVKLNTGFQKEEGDYEKIFYTGPIDAYFQEVGLPKLEYRSLRFEIEQLSIPYFQENSVINYTDKEVPYTRIIEYKHFLNQQTPTTTIVKEYSSDVGEPYYPIPNPENQALYEKYRKLASQEKNIYFVGRLANYKYFNMDDAILNALELFDSLQMNSIHASKID